MEITVAQINCVNGDISRNFDRINEIYKNYKNVLIHPKTLTGFNLKSLAGNPDFIEKEAQLRKIIDENNKKLSVPFYFLDKPWHKNFKISPKSFGIYLNPVGGFDEDLFSGGSVVINPDGTTVYQFKKFKEEITTLSFDENYCKTFKRQEKYDNNKDIFEAITLSLHDYVIKSGFKKVLIGLSGGMDSAMVTTFAKEAFLKENISCVLLPSKYTSELSNKLALDLCKSFKINHKTIPITPVFDTFKKEISPFLDCQRNDCTFENLQARVRGIILMSLSNRNDAMLLATSNKSEIFAGYSTLYGDSCGGFNPLKDLFKTEIYELANWYNNNYKDKIPQEIITRAPSAELKENQKDSDNLPEYEIFDDILKLILEKNKSFAEITSKGYNGDIVKKIFKLVSLSEYKRYQSVIGVNLSKFSVYKKTLPLVNKFFYELL